MAGDEIKATAGDGVENFVAGKNNRQESTRAGTIVNFSASENFLEFLRYTLQRIEQKQDLQNERLGKLERQTEYQTEKIVGQAERLRGIESDVAILKEAQTESKRHRQEMDKEIKALQAQMSMKLSGISGQVEDLPQRIQPAEIGLQQLKPWQWMVLAVLAMALLLGAVPIAIAQILAYFQ